MTSEIPEIQLVDQQTDFIIINKPAGVSFHNEQQQLGLFHQVKSMLAVPELYPVHRLDKMTSGLIIFATTKESANRFQELFKQHEIEKYYLALSDKKPKKKQGLIKGDMEKSRRGMWKLMRTNDNPAISQFFSYSIEQGLRLFLIKPHTGKTHQIRVALASIGAAILGDNYYGKTTADRGYLHAYALQFNYHNKLYQYVLPPTSGDYFNSSNAQTKIMQLNPPWQLEWPTKLT
ncbi:TIGR01621 family pseudouridine synthase [Thalassotalea sp. G2M2-11]|uniref:TIGR01621 family pseudouridine synthase n=1 Tax=Thalassotalea sp. G2M2-11 TaxID=2787627 RepID=UPI0019D24B0D|nr:TIGR01621 family pseudouridine synthase [Thalassotalea sp. G2M2-11]